MPRIFQVHQQPAGAPQLRVKGVNAPPGAHNAPLRVRTRVAGLGAFPDAYGGPGSEVWPYTESTQWGDGSQGGAAPSMVPPDIGTPPAALSPQQLDVISTPNGQSTRPWTNPTTYAGFPIVPSLGSIQSVLNMNPRRNSLIIQNTSTATSPDVAPTLYIGFNAEPGLNTGALALPPGLGFYWSAADCPPRDNIYVVFLGGNAGATVIIHGSVIQGTYIPDSSQVAPMHGAATSRGPR
jgi:hypothetical protein